MLRRKKHELQKDGEAPDKRREPFWFAMLVAVEQFMRKRWWVLLLVGLALLPSLYFYQMSQEARNANQSSGGNLQTTEDVVRQVGRHILLPSGEQPTVATVSDATKVRNQNFFANAANGDKVLVYAKAQKAYLYRPGIDRVIEVAPLAPNQNNN